MLVLTTNPLFTILLKMFQTLQEGLGTFSAQESRTFSAQGSHSRLAKLQEPQPVMGGIRGKRRWSN